MKKIVARRFGSRFLAFPLIASLTLSVPFSAFALRPFDFTQGRPCSGQALRDLSMVEKKASDLAGLEEALQDPVQAAQRLANDFLGLAPTPVPTAGAEEEVVPGTTLEVGGYLVGGDPKAIGNLPGLSLPLYHISRLEKGEVEVSGYVSGYSLFNPEHVVMRRDELNNGTWRYFPSNQSGEAFELAMKLREKAIHRWRVSQGLTEEGLKLSRGTDVIPIVTPLIQRLDGTYEVDEEALDRLLGPYFDAIGGTAILGVGATGEFHRMDSGLRRSAIKIVAEKAKEHGRFAIINVTGNAFQETLEDAQLAVESGANALLVLPPFLEDIVNDGQVEALVQQLKKVGGNLPLGVYINPAITKWSVSPETIKQLFEAGLIQFVKDSTGYAMGEAAQATFKAYHDTGVPIGQGYDKDTAWALREGGATWIVAATGQVVPAAQRYGDSDSGQWDEIQKEIASAFDIVTVNGTKSPEGLKRVLSQVTIQGKPLMNPTIIGEPTLTNPERQAIDALALHKTLTRLVSQPAAGAEEGGMARREFLGNVAGKAAIVAAGATGVVAGILLQRGAEDGQGKGVAERTALTVTEARGILQQLAIKWNLTNLGELRIAAVSPQAVAADPNFQGLIGKPVAIGDVRLVVVPPEENRMNGLVVSFMDETRSVMVQGYGQQADTVLDNFERIAHRVGFDVSAERILPKSQAFRDLLRALIANLSHLKEEAIEEDDLIAFERALAALA